MSTFISTVIKVGQLTQQLFTYTFTFTAGQQKQEVLCEVFYPLDPNKMEQRVSTHPQGVELFNFTSSQKTREEVEAHSEQMGGELLSVGTMTPNPKMHHAVTTFVYTLNAKFGLLSTQLLKIFPYLWQKDAEFHFKVPLTNDDQVKKFFEFIKKVPAT